MYMKNKTSQTLVMPPEVESSRASLASRTLFEVIGFGLEANKSTRPRNDIISIAVLQRGYH